MEIINDLRTSFNWRTFKTPNYVAGAIIIEIDDGFMGSYSHWFPLCRKLAKKHNQWRYFNAVVCCPAVNTASINTSNTYMTSAQLQRLCVNGWEIMSHGKYHCNFGSMSLTAPANAGQKRIDLPHVGGLNSLGVYTYKIQEGENVEEITIATMDIAEKYITVTNNLVNSYTTAAKFSLTSQSIIDLLQGCIDDLAGWGITCKSHVWPYHYGSQAYYNAEAVAIVASLFDSARGVSGDYNTAVTDKHLMKSRLLNDDLTEATIDTILNTTLTNDYVTIFYGHGETTILRLAQLEYLIEGAFTRGIKILTRSKALERLL